MASPTVSVREWTDVVRRARLGRTIKHIAFTVASYADYRDGTRIHVGLAKLSVAAEVSYKTAKNGVAFLLQCGLLEVVGARRSGTRLRGTEYRLTLGENVLDHIDVLSPATFDLEADRLGQAQRRDRSTGNAAPRTDPVDNSEYGVADAPYSAPETGVVRGTARPQPTEVRGTARPQYGVRHAAISSKTVTQLLPPTPEADVRTAVTASRAGGSEQDPVSPSCGRGGCIHGFVLTADGQRIEHCPDPSHPPPDNVVPFPRTA